MKIYLIRHGQTDWNLDRKIQGCTDISLNETGLRQADLLAEAMKDRPVTRVFSSRLKRAYETAWAVARVQRQDVTVVRGLEEVDFGAWEGMTWGEIEKTYPEDFRLWDSNPVQCAPTKGERQEAVKLRCKTAMEYILGNSAGDIAIVSHGAMLAFVVDYLFSAMQGDREKIIVRNASITTVEYERDSGNAVLVGLNEDGYLAKD